MSEMIERVGLVIMKADGCGLTNDSGKRVFCDDSSIPIEILGDRPCECRQTARAAIEAMRSPTWAMARAALNACPIAPDGMDPKEADIFVMQQEFRAMISAALQD